MREKTVGEVLRRNTRAAMLGWATYTVARFIQTPIIFDVLGKERAGLWMFTFAFLHYLSIYNFGISAAYVKYTAEHHIDKRYKDLGHLLSTGVAAGAVVAAGVIALLYLYTGDIFRFFDKNGVYPDPAEAEFVIFMVGAVMAFAMVGGVYRSVLQGIQRIDVLGYIAVVVNVLEFVSVLTALYLGWGLRGLVWVFIGVSAARNTANFFVARRLLPELRVNPFRARLRCLRPLFSLGGQMQLLGAVSLMVASLDNLVFTRFGGFLLQGTYGAARNMIRIVQNLPRQGLGPLTPASADLHARGDYEKLRDVYSTSNRITFVISLYIAGFTVFFSDLIMHGYIGDKEYVPLMGQALAMLAVSAVFHNLTGPGSSMLRGAGKPWYEMSYQIITIVAFVALYFVARPAGNEVMIIATWPIGLGFASFLFVALTNTYFHAPLLMPFEKCIPLTLTALGAAGALRWLWELTPFADAPSRWYAAGAVVGAGLVYSVIFAAGAWVLPGLTRGDRQQLVRFVPMGSRIAKRAGLL